MKVIVTNAQWDVKVGDDCDNEEQRRDILSELPKDFEIDVDFSAIDTSDHWEVENVVSDSISDKYGFCHNGFSFSVPEIDG